MFNKKYLMILVGVICTMMHTSGLSTETLASFPDGVLERIGAFGTKWKCLKRDYAFKTITVAVEDLPSLLKPIVQEINNVYTHYQKEGPCDQLSKLPELQSLIQNIFDSQVNQLSNLQRPYPVNLSWDQRADLYANRIRKKDLCFSGITITTKCGLECISIQPILIDYKSDKVVFKLCTPAYPHLNGLEIEGDHYPNPNNFRLQWRKQLDCGPTRVIRDVYGMLTVDLEGGTASSMIYPTPITEFSCPLPVITLLLEGLVHLL